MNAPSNQVFDVQVIDAPAVMSCSQSRDTLVDVRWMMLTYRIQWSLRIKDTLGAELLSSFRRLSSGGRFIQITISRNYRQYVHVLSVWTLFQAKELAEIKNLSICCSQLNGSMISNNITNDLYHIGLKMWVWFPVCAVIRGSFAHTWSVWEHEACPLSGIKKVRSWEVVSVYLDIVISIRAIQLVSFEFIERFSSGGRVRYGRFHCSGLFSRVHNFRYMAVRRNLYNLQLCPSFLLRHASQLNRVWSYPCSFNHAHAQALVTLL